MLNTLLDSSRFSCLEKVFLFRLRSCSIFSPPILKCMITLRIRRCAEVCYSVICKVFALLAPQVAASMDEVTNIHLVGFLLDKCNLLNLMKGLK